jgi:flagellar basal body rod protein FlgC
MLESSDLVSGYPMSQDLRRMRFMTENIFLLASHEQEQTQKLRRGATMLNEEIHKK